MVVGRLGIESNPDDERHGAGEAVEGELFADRVAVQRPAWQPLDPAPRVVW